MRDRGPVRRCLAAASWCLICMLSAPLIGHAQQSALQAIAQVQAALRAQQFGEALQTAEAALRQTPDDPRLWTLEAVAYQGLQNPAAALRCFKHALDVAPQFLPALEGAAETAYATHSAEAQALLSRLVSRRPGDPVAHAMLGELAVGQKDCAAAAANFEKAGAAIADRPPVLMQYSACLVRLSRYDEAARVFQQLIALEPGDPMVRGDLALAQYRAGHLEDAEASLAPLVAGTDPGEDTLTLAADIAEARGHTQEALDLLRRAILLYPRLEGAYLDYANLAYQHASAQVGLDMVNLGLQQMPGSAQLYFARGVLLCQLGKTDQGFTAFQRANQLDPSLSFIGVAQGVAQSQAHNQQAALRQFQRAVQAHPRDGLAWYLLAEALSEQGYAKGTPGQRQALHASERAVELAPHSAEARDLEATLYLQQDDMQGAITASRAALAINPQDPQALYHLVLAVRQTSDKQELPALLQRLMAARRLAQEQTEQQRPHMLVEQPAQ